MADDRKARRIGGADADAVERLVALFLNVTSWWEALGVPPTSSENVSPPAGESTGVTAANTVETIANIATTISSVPFAT